jgi:photosynthetic reaction center H subunit
MEPYNVVFFGNVDLAQISLYLFWAFFAGLVIYLQRENMREGYPLEDEEGAISVNQGPYGEPGSKKTFKLPHGQGSITVPETDKEKRKISLKRDNIAGGAPFSPTGNPMVDGVGAAAWAERRDTPELDGHGKPKIVPMRTLKKFEVSAGRDPRGMNVVAADNKVVGKISDLWVDAPEQLVRYLEIELKDKSSCLVPMPLALIKANGVNIDSLFSKHFAKVPRTKAQTRITMLEEEKISAYFTGGKLYASYDRLVSPF